MKYIVVSCIQSEIVILFLLTVLDYTSCSVSVKCVQHNKPNLVAW